MPPPFGPILKVMRIQSPSLASYYSTCTNYPTLIPNSISNVLLLPDSFGNIHVGETFSACLSVTNALLNTVKSPASYNNSVDNVPLPILSNITNLSINSYLQTPTQRHRLVNPADSLNRPNGCTVPLGGHVDVFVSQLLEEVGQHILRVEISYCDGGDSSDLDDATISSNTVPSSTASQVKTIRKFYRFQVTESLQIKHFALRHGDASCWVSVDIENILPPSNTESSSNLTRTEEDNQANSANINRENHGPSPFTPCDNSPDLTLTLTSVVFKPADGLSAEMISPQNSVPVQQDDILKSNESLSTQHSRRLTAVQLYDSIVRLRPRESHRYLFRVQAASESAIIRGIASGDILGQIEVHWRRSLSDTGCVRSPFVYTPSSMPISILNRLGTLNSYIGDISKVNSVAAMDEIDAGFVVDASGLSVDTAAAAAAASNNTTHTKSLSHASSSSFRLEEILPVTVEPIDPPTKMILGDSYPVELLIVNHGKTPLHAHLQMRLSVMKGVVISGPSFINLGEIPPNGGSTAAMIHLLALLPGLFQVRGCFIVDPTNGREIAQPPLFRIYVHDEVEERE